MVNKVTFAVQVYLVEECEGNLGSVYPPGGAVVGMNPFLASYQHHQARTTAVGYTIPTAAVSSMQQYMNLQGMSPFSHPPHLNPSLLSAAQLQAAQLTNVALRQAAATTVTEKAEKIKDTKNHDNEKSEPTKKLAYSIDRLLKKDEAKKEEKPDSDDHISSTSDSVESVTTGRHILTYSFKVSSKTEHCTVRSVSKMTKLN